MTKTKITWGFLVIMLVLAGVILLLLTTLPYDVLSTYLDLFAKDGQLESFTPELHTKLSGWEWLGWILELCAAGMIAARKRTQSAVERFLLWADKLIHEYRRDAQSLWASCAQSVQQERVHLIGLGILFAAAAIYSGRFLSRPMGYDEAYTFNIFASRPILRIISDYHLPNNHIFHSLLVHFSTAIFGSQPWAVRLPAFLAGLLLIPAGYLTARMFFNRDAAILTAGALGFLPILIMYSTNARGYTLMALFTLIILASGAYLQKHLNRVLWAIMILFAVLGFYTLPTMLLPFGAICLWIFLNWTLGNTHPAHQRKFVLRLIFLGIAVGLFVILLYTPVIMVSGLDSLIDNPFVAPIQTEEYWDILADRLTQTWAEFNKGVPPILSWLLVAAFLGGLLLQPQKASFPVILIVFSMGLVVLRRNAPFDRMWLFLLPIYLIWASAGLVQVFKRTIEPKIPSQIAATLKIALLFAIIFPLVLGGTEELQRLTQKTEYSEAVALFLGSELTTEDRVIVDFPYDAPIVYYTRLYGFDDGKTFSLENAQRYLILVNENAGQAPEELISQRQIPINTLEMSSLTLLEEIPPISIYQLKTR